MIVVSEYYLAVLYPAIEIGKVVIRDTELAS